MYATNVLIQADFSSLKHFDLATLLEMVEDKGMILHLLAMFREDSLRNKKEVDEALSQKDYKLAFERLHTLKGSAYILGANQLGETAKILEPSIKAGKLDEGAYQAFEIELSEIQAELTTMLSKR